MIVGHSSKLRQLVASSGGDARESARDSVSRAANLLSRAVELLSNDGSCAVSDRTGARSGDSNVSGASSSESAAQHSSSSEQWRTRATANFHRIFGGLQPRSQDQRAGGRSGKRISGKSVAAKRTLNPSTGQWFWKRETWTHKFYCFPKTHQICPENRNDREVSRLAGLGEKKITFRKGADSAEVLTELEEAFPRLKDGGGFELLRSGQRVKDLVLIPSPPGGYSVSFLKNCGLGQSTIYVRPIQRDLDTTPIGKIPSEDAVSYFLMGVLKESMRVVGLDRALLTVSVEKKFKRLLMRNTHSRTVCPPVIYSLLLKRKKWFTWTKFHISKTINDTSLLSLLIIIFAIINFKHQRGKGGVGLWGEVRQNTGIGL